MMKISSIFPYTSKQFRCADVISEVKELLQAETKEEVVEEIRDIVTTALLLLYARTGIDVWIPSIFTSAEKYIERMKRCREVLKEEGLYDAEREAEEPFYFVKYTRAGSNLLREEKREKFRSEARKDLKWRGE